MNITPHINYDSQIYFLNGINVSLEEYQSSQADLGRMIKSQIQASYNPSDGIWQDLYHATNGLINNRKGQDLEYQIISKLELALRQDLKNNRNIKIFAHSQGSIILRNILVKLQLENYSFKKIKVFTFGAANYFWPKNLQVFSFNNQSDYLARTLNHLTAAYNNYIFTPWNNLKSFFEPKNNLPQLEFLDSVVIRNQIKNPIKAHEWQNYLGNFRNE